MDKFTPVEHIELYLDFLSSFLGDAVVESGIKSYLLSRDKTISRLSSFVSD